jgi:hypothetical protein
LTHVTLRVAFDLISVSDASRHTVQAYGEALDESDKATAKAMSGAYKSAMLQVFCIPVIGSEDPDHGKALPHRRHGPEPVQGWEAWGRDMIEMISSCESKEALSRVQQSNRALLKAVQRERHATYQKIGDEFAARLEALASAPKSSCPAEVEVAPRGKMRKRKTEEVQLA